MKVHEVMYRILSCNEDTDLSKVVELMMEKRRASIMVLKKEIPIGIFTERDALRLLASKINIEKLKIKDAMREPKHVIHESASVHEAAQLMEEKGIRRLPVVNNEGKAVGIITANIISKNMKFMMARGMSSGLSSFSQTS